MDGFLSGARGKPEYVYDLFMRYATREPRVGATWLLRPPGLRRLLRETRALDGLPPNLVDAYVRQLMLRADMDQDGALSVEEFVLWFASEAVAVLPFTTWQCLYGSIHRLSPLYNRFADVCFRKHLGWDPGAKRRQAPGVTVAQLIDLLVGAGVIGPSSREDGEVRLAARLALQGVRAERLRRDRVQGQVEDANHLSFTLFVKTITLSAAKGMGLAHALLRLMSAGAPPPARLPPPPPPGEDNELLDNLFMCADIEGPLFEVGEEWPAGSGTTHPVWYLSSPTNMQSHMKKAQAVYSARLRGVTFPRSFYPSAKASKICCRNLRAAFTRYCVRWNKGPMPPSNAPPSPQRGGLPAPEPLDSPWAWHWGACCCCFRQLSTMELSTFLRIVSDSPTVQAALSHPGSALTPHRLQNVFTFAAGIAGVYMNDDSTGVHDMPVQPGGGSPGQAGPAMQMPRGRASHGPGGVSRFGATTKGLEMLRQSLPAGQRAAMQMATAWTPLRGRGGAEWEADGSPPPSPSGRESLTAAGTVGARQGHRPPVLCLTFVQFIDSLRLLAEEAVGHPVQNDMVEAVLLFIVGDIASSPFPQPDGTSAGAAAASAGYTARPGSAPARLRKRPMLFSAGGAGGAMGSGTFGSGDDY
ncbi:hypothetical protein HYH03_008189 [Edaphochlamys debaryana]|uniref:EF-hand domain-containing protein n=1 Tax=Edaphochlamys debaryana TaxID=47281 RepID=A0A836BYJ9_9CHLO|nr:hypothetical protein HYH03_008189 [Edaphochlamys debaryana]|eukprot:KAG2493675.1 hypothetical protein HYH03_008189 [Edaphochlamys debaryana]